jgi:hypothetical protein
MEPFRHVRKMELFDAMVQIHVRKMELFDAMVQRHVRKKELVVAMVERHEDFWTWSGRWSFLMRWSERRSLMLLWSEGMEPFGHGQEDGAF